MTSPSIKTIKRLLGTEINLDFLLQLKVHELEMLIACIRDRLDKKQEA